MNEALRHEIVQRRQAGASIRAIARALGISRGAVGRVLAQVQTQRDGPSAPLPRPRRRGSLLDEYEPILQELLTRYPARARLPRPVHHRPRADTTFAAPPDPGTSGAL
jgi:transposase-like protein